MAHPKGRNGCNVTRLVATEHVRNKCALLESFSLHNSHATISSFQTAVSKPALIALNQIITLTGGFLSNNKKTN